LKEKSAIQTGYADVRYISALVRRSVEFIEESFKMEILHAEKKK